MHPRVQGERTDRALATIQEQAGEISRLFGLDASVAEGVNAFDRDREVRELLRMEGVAALLAEVVPQVAGLQEQLAAAQQAADDLATQIGTPPEGSHPDEALPRSGTWHQERANWLAETDQMRAYIAGVEQRLKAAQDEAKASQERIALLETAAAKSAKKKADDPPADPAA